ncbi:AAA family ATPase [Legionella pneumophila]|uniref:AAA family ATPase n=1 Tax=Legionella pneumophila TaxID=446 RepID=UPI00058B8D58|nr:AAA family ATPase [Legionella pneumophila]HAT2079995.1 AAA family ATPase [Legionella pneumophila]
MLVKVNHIKNVGRFYEVMPKGTADSSPTFEKFNLIYADNGTGKTTLSAILKSLANNEPERILTRKTIPGNNNCEVSLSIDNKECNFLNNSWKKLPDSTFMIFDDEFIEKSVFSPSGIDTNHKRQLFNYVVLGEENVIKAREMQSLIDNEIPNLTKDITVLESQLKQAANVNDIKLLIDIEPLPLKDFEQLKSDVETKGMQLKNSEIIKTQKTLNLIHETRCPDFMPLLTKGLEDIGKVEDYQNYIFTHQKWIQEGLQIQGNNENCPYCFQSLSGNEIVMSYKQFFSEECQLMLNQLTTLSQDVKNNFSDEKLLLVTKTIEANNDVFTFWKAMDKSLPERSLNVDKFISQLKSYRETILKLIDKKQKNILEPVKIDGDDQENLNAWEAISESIKTYNIFVNSVNQKIEEIKSQHADIDKLQQEHDNNELKLKCIKSAFHDKSIMELLAGYKTLLKKKQDTVDSLNKLRAEINANSIKLLQNYRDTINKLLKSFGVEFRINKVEQKVDTARKDSLTFTIELKGMSFDPNGSRQVPYSLNNTLSSGDKSTLAFALFMAKLEHAVLDDTIVIFDDPISSLDFFRKQQTSKQISTLSKKARQTIVLTHSMEFAKLFGHVPEKSKYFKLFKVDSMAGVFITPYNKLTDMSVSKHYDEHEALQKYLNMPNSVERLDVMKSIRSYVETKLCVYYPELVKLHPPTLGTFIAHFKKIKIAQSYIDELELINDSIVVENHGGSPIIDDHANLTDEELRNLCRLALELNAPPT